ncbi:MAG: hypothetical protein KKH85_08145 [Proteobacteria bacterium]|nr:hypothetical protein [Pseudomonadota bacterium]
MAKLGISDAENDLLPYFTTGKFEASIINELILIISLLIIAVMMLLDFAA